MATTIRKEISKIHMEFYKRAIKLHEDENLNHLLSGFFLDEELTGLCDYAPWVELASIENRFMKDDKEKFPAKYTIEQYSLYFWHGFGMVEHLQGDPFHIKTRRPYEIKRGKLVYESEERGIWPMLEAFPDITIPYVEGKILTALEEIKTGVRGEIRELEGRISKKNDNLELIGAGIEDFTKSGEG